MPMRKPAAIGYIKLLTQMRKNLLGEGMVHAVA